MSLSSKISEKLLANVSKSVPKVSSTEQAALDAGNTWWEADLFSGNPDLSKLNEIPVAELTAEEQSFLDNETQTLCEMMRPWDEFKDKDLSPEIWKYIKDNGFLGMIIPKEYGGKGFSALAHSAVVSKISTSSCSGAVSVMVPNSLGPAELLLKYGTDDQKDRYLSGLASGAEIPCFALTSPKAGSDAAGIPDTGVVAMGQYKGKEVLGINVTWDKRYITLAPVATVMGLAFKVTDPNGLINNELDLGITVALIPTDHDGVEIGNRHYPANQSFMNGPTRGNDVFIPMEFIVGGQHRIGHGWEMLMNCLAEGRAVSLPALGTGALKYVARYVGGYTKVREQFGIPLAKMEGIQEKLADVASDAYAMEAARVFTCSALAQGIKPSVPSAIMKYQATERMRNAIDAGMDILGGKAVIDGPTNFLSNFYYALPVSITVEGANILTRTLMVYGQGVIRCHPYMRDEFQAVVDQDADALVKLLRSHIWHGVSNVRRGAMRGFKGYWSKGLDSSIKRESAVFAAVSDALMANVGGGIKKNGMISGLMADAFSELYILSAIKRCGDTRPEMETIRKYAIEKSLYTFEKTMIEILDNFPSKKMGKALKFAFYPLGRRNKKPSHELMKAVSQSLTESEDVRDIISSGIFVTTCDKSPVGIQELAYQAVMHSHPDKQAKVDNACAVDEFTNLKQFKQ